MTFKNLPIAVIACQVLQDLLPALMPGEQITFMEYGLHENPQKLRETLQNAIDKIWRPNLVVLGYGLCGNGLDNIQAGKHHLLVPRADDCIALLLGSYQAYVEEFHAVPGTYYLSKGWLEAGSHPLSEYEEYVARYGAKKAAKIMDVQYHNYERLVLVTHNQADLEKYRPLAQEVARYCAQWGLRYEERVGSDSYVQRLAQAARAPDAAGEDFVLISPGGALRQGDFLRR